MLTKKFTMAITIFASDGVSDMHNMNYNLCF